MHTGTATPNPIKSLSEKQLVKAAGTNASPTRRNCSPSNGTVQPQVQSPLKANLVMPMRNSIEPTDGSSASGLSPSRAKYSLAKLNPNTAKPNPRAPAPRVRCRRTAVQSICPFHRQASAPASPNITNGSNNA